MASLWLGRALTRPMTVVVALMSLLFALVFGTGCGRSSFDDQLEDDSGVSETSSDGGDDGSGDTSDDTFDSEPPPDTFIPPDGPVTLISISIEPASATLAVGGTQLLTARGLYSDGIVRDVTTLATWSSIDPKIASVAPSSGLVQGITPGSTRVRATLDGKFGEADIIVKGGTITSVVVDPSFADMIVGGSASFTATAIYSDGSSADVTSAAMWTTGDPMIASVVAGTVTAVSPGSTSLTATFSGLSGFAKISVTGGKTLKSVEISPFSPTVGIGVSVNLVATAIYTDGSKSDVTGTAAWSVTDATIAKIAPGPGAEIATGASAGSTIISATFGGMTGTTPITVSGATLTTITLSPSAATISPGGTVTITATAVYSDGSKVDVTGTAAWSSSDAGIATVGAGKVTGVAAGTATVTATFGGKSGTATITVSPAKIVSIAVSPNPATAPLGSKVTLKATATYSDGSTRDVTADVTWSTDTPAVATVSNAAADKGTVTPVKVGTTLAHAKLDGIDGTATINVTAAAVTGITITPNPLSMVVSTKQLTKATATYSDGTTLDVTATCTWATGDAKVASVSNGAGSQGQVTAVGAGTTTLTCTLSGVTGTATITVTGSTLSSVTVSPINPTCRVGDTLQFQAFAINTAGTSTNVTFAAMWSSSATSIVSPLGPPGRFRCLAKGTATVTAAYSGKSGSSLVTVTDAIPVSLEIDPVNASIAVATVQQYQAIAHYSDGTTTNVTNATAWSSSDPTVAGITTGGGGGGGGPRGRATGVKAGTTTIKGTWSGISGSTSLTVTNAVVTSISITPSTVSVPAGVTYQYQATALYSDGTSKDVTALASWSSSDATIVAVSNALGSRGQAKSLAPGSVKITATYSGVSGTANATVTTAKLKTVQVTPFKPTLPIGYGIRLTATAIYDDGTTFTVTGQATWASTDSSIATVSNALGSRGRVTPVAAGTATISATYNGVTGSTDVKVTAATLSSIAITPNPAAITIGGNQQLTATGTFSDGSKLDITEFVAWSSSDTSVADVSNATDTKGIAYGFKAGTVTVTAQKGAVSATSTATVK
ncbi:MAG: beta strand repeat-containing protein [Polyangiales bacterium]